SPSSPEEFVFDPSRDQHRFAYRFRLNTRRLDRHRGGGCPPTPATPPCVRVRTRRFESVTLSPVDQRRKSERVEVRIREPDREGLGLGKIPGTETTAGCIAGQPRTDTQFDESRPTTARCF